MFAEATARQAAAATQNGQGGSSAQPIPIPPSNASIIAQMTGTGPAFTPGGISSGSGYSTGGVSGGPPDNVGAGSGSSGSSGTGYSTGGVSGGPPDNVGTGSTAQTGGNASSWGGTGEKT